MDKVEFIAHEKNYIESQRERFFDAVKAVTAQVIKEGIKANSIIINKNMVRVPETRFYNPLGVAFTLPNMICGLNVYVTKDELPDNYSFAVFKAPNRNRLSQFESIGMEPDELRKAAELYRRVKEVIE